MERRKSRFVDLPVRRACILRDEMLTSYKTAGEFLNSLWKVYDALLSTDECTDTVAWVRMQMATCWDTPLFV